RDLRDRDGARPQGPPVGTAGRGRLRGRTHAGADRRGERSPRTGTRGRMSTVIPAGFSVEVTAPATCANLGAGYDSFGLALGIADTVRARLAEAEVPHDSRVTVRGEGAGFLPRSGDHLILRIAEQILAAREVSGADRLVLECDNAIPQS